MRKKEKTQKQRNKALIMTIVILLAFGAVLLTFVSAISDGIAPVYQMTVKGMHLRTPYEVQAACRADFEDFRSASEEYDDCIWVWCGGSKMFLVKNNALTVCADSDYDGFTRIQFTNNKLKMIKGYIIDAEKEPNELARIDISDAEDFSFDSVSMSVRIAIADGRISFDDACYLWESGSNTVFAVSKDKIPEDSDGTVTFTDDGGQRHLCRILDTDISDEINEEEE